MSWASNHDRAIVLLAALLAAFPPVSMAGEEKDQEKKTVAEDNLDEEFSLQEDDDFPDLVGADETGEIMDEFLLLQEEDIVFTAAKHKQHVSESPSAITVITREEIENTHCTDVICLLRYVPEVDVIRMSPMYAAVGARAHTDTSGDKVLVLVDGREINLEVFGFPVWQGLPVHMEEIDRIEVIRGPGSALYGANAYAMVVSISTREATNSSAEMFLGAGERYQMDLNALANLVLGNWRLFISGSGETSGIWRIRGQNEKKVGRLRLRLDHKVNSSRSTIQICLLQPEGKIFAGLAPANIFNSFMGSLFLAHHTDILKAQVSFDLFDTSVSFDLPLVYNGMTIGKLPPSVDILSSTLDAEVQLTYSPFSGNLIVTGGNYRWITFLSEYNDPKTIHQHRVGLFVHDEQRLWEHLVLTAGVRLDYNSITPLTVSPRTAGVWRFAEGHSLRLAFGTAFHKPSFLHTSLHFKGVQSAPGFDDVTEFFQYGIGNDELKNERIIALEAGYGGRFFEEHFTVDLEIFYNRYLNPITFHLRIVTNDYGVPDLNHSEMKFENWKQSFNLLGGSISVGYRIKKTFRINANYTYRYGWTSPGWLGDTRMRVNPPHLVNLSFHYITKRGVRMGAALQAASSTKIGIPRHGNIFEGMFGAVAPARRFFSGFVAWRKNFSTRWIELGMKANNILNEKFRDSASVMRTDGTLLGAEPIGRSVFTYLRGSI